MTLKEVYVSFPSGNRFKCVFINNKDMDSFDCAFDDFHAAINFVRLIMSVISSVSSGRIIDQMNNEVLFIGERS